VTSLSLLLYKVLINKNILTAKINIEMGPNPIEIIYTKNNPIERILLRIIKKNDYCLVF